MYFYNIDTGQVEVGSAPGRSLMGPYDTYEAAERALEASQARNRAWDEQDTAWQGDSVWPEHDEPALPQQDEADWSQVPAWGCPEVADSSGAPAWGFPTSEASAELEVFDRIDVNTAPASLLATLPGVTRADARKAVQYRSLVGGFPTLEDFAFAVGPQNTTVAMLRERAFCSPEIPRGPMPSP